MADRTVDTNLNVTGTVNATTVQEGGVPVVVSPTINDIVSISQAAYDALGAGRPAGRFYLITS
jgi:hypothetical protein